MPGKHKPRNPDHPNPPSIRGRAEGRPRKQIDWVQFDKLCFMFCTESEIASWFDCSIDTIENAVQREKGVRFADYYKQKSDGGKTAIRRAQLSTALGGSVAMQIWLGKQKLGQRDQLDHRLSGPDGGPVQTLNYAKLSLAELDALEDLRNKAAGNVGDGK
jgi:hypothetical protein